MSSSESTDIERALDCIQRPEQHHPDGRFPLGEVNNTYWIKDYYIDNGFTTPVNNEVGAVTVSGYGFITTFGHNSIRSATYCITDQDTRADALYGTSFFFLDADGAIINFPAASPPNPLNIVNYHVQTNSDARKKRNKIRAKQSTNETSSSDDFKEISIKDKSTRVKVDTVSQPYWTYDPVNMESTLGSTNGYTNDGAIITGLRINAQGSLGRSVIEMITDSNTFGVARYFMSDLTPQAIDSARDQQLNMYNLVQQGNCFRENANNQGWLARYNPCQDGTPDPMKIQPLANLVTSSISTDNISFPTIIVRLTELVDIDQNQSFTFPVRHNITWWIEGFKKEPGPIVADRVPLAPNFHSACKAMAYDIIKFPHFEESHTWRVFNRRSLRALGAIDPKLKQVGQGVNVGARMGMTANKIGKGRYGGAANLWKPNPRQTSHKRALQQANNRQSVAGAKVRGDMSSVLFRQPNQDYLNRGWNPPKQNNNRRGRGGARGRGRSSKPNSIRNSFAFRQYQSANDRAMYHNFMARGRGR